MENANKEFEIVKKSNSNFRWLKVWESAYLLKMDQKEQALKLAKETFKNSIGVRKTFKIWKIFNPIRDELFKDENNDSNEDSDSV